MLPNFFLHHMVNSVGAAHAGIIGAIRIGAAAAHAHIFRSSNLRFHVSNHWNIFLRTGFYPGKFLCRPVEPVHVAVEHHAHPAAFAQAFLFFYEHCLYCIHGKGVSVQSAHHQQGVEGVRRGRGRGPYRRIQAVIHRTCSSRIFEIMSRITRSCTTCHFFLLSFLYFKIA